MRILRPAMDDFMIYDSLGYGFHFISLGSLVIIPSFHQKSMAFIGGDLGILGESGRSTLCMQDKHEKTGGCHGISSESQF